MVANTAANFCFFISLKQKNRYGTKQFVRDDAASPSTTNDTFQICELVHEFIDIIDFIAMIKGVVEKGGYLRPAMCRQPRDPDAILRDEIERASCISI